MIVRGRASWLTLVFTFRRSALERIWLRLLVTAVLAVAVTELYHFGYVDLNLTVTPFTLIGLALSIFLGFRNNTSYDRFWEGRKLWGQLVNTSRSLARQVLTLVGPHATDGPAAAPAELAAAHRELIYRIIAFVHALRLHLRDEWTPEALAHLLPAADLAALEGERNRPYAVLQGLGDALRRRWDADWVSPFHIPVLEASLCGLADIQGGCERIKSTPIPHSYTVLIHRIVAIYCITLPFGLVQTIGQLTPVVVVMVAYAFYGLDAVGDEIENPFGLDPNDLPLTALSRMIEVNLRQRLGETDLPPLLEPVDDILA
ncbi:MAG TPA: bestrophin family ion channel [Nannocystaceae bacterium]|nr:bestrophin family ion channel [Nannocystaceae bacterium]